MRADVRARRPLTSRRGAPQRCGDQGAVLARCAAFDEFGVGDQAMAEGDLFDDIDVVAWAAEPLVDDVDQTDMIGAIEAGVHQIGPIDVEDHKSCRATLWVADRAGDLGSCGMSKFHAVIMTRGCDAVV
jgi:hypothetical protein